ncbi:hypothetical protein ACLOAV_005373 [Pseudogymnoascus australis]
MALARSASGPGALSINIGSANSFGSTNTSSQAPAAGGLFGKATMSQPTGGLFGQAQTTQPQTTQGSGLFGSSTTATQPAQTGGLFGAASAAPQSGGLFGGAPASTQPQSSGLFGGAQAAQTPASTGGMFGSAQSQQPQQTGGGLFGGANTQNQAKPSFFGSASTQQPQQQQQQPQSSLFSSSARPQQSTGAFGSSFAGGLTMGQSQGQPTQATVPGVRIDLSNLRNTTRFNDLNEELQKKIEEFDAGVLSLMAKGDQCTAILPAHGEQLELVPDNVDFLQRKVIGVQSNLDGDVQAVSQTSKQVYVDGENAKLSFTVVDNLKLPQQFHTGIWNPSKPSPSASPGEAAGDLVSFFSQTSDEMGQTISTYKENISEIELHLRGVERSLMQAGSNIGRNGQDKNEVENLVGVLRDFEMGILEVAGRVGGAREGVQSLQLGHFIDPVSVNVNGKRRGVY